MRFVSPACISQPNSLNAPPAASPPPPHEWGGKSCSVLAPPAASPPPPHEWGGKSCSVLAPPAASPPPPHEWGGKSCSVLAPPAASRPPPHEWGGESCSGLARLISRTASAALRGASWGTAARLGGSAAALLPSSPSTSLNWSGFTEHVRSIASGSRPTFAHQSVRICSCASSCRPVERCSRGPHTARSTSA